MARWTGEFSDSVIQLRCTGKDDGIHLLTLLTVAPTDLRWVCPMTAAKTSLSVYLGTFAAASWAAVRLHFYKRWQLMKSLKRRERKKKNRFAILSPFVSAPIWHSGFLNTDFFFYINNSLLHVIFLVTGISFHYGTKHVPSFFCPAVKLPGFFSCFLNDSRWEK